MPETRWFRLDWSIHACVRPSTGRPFAWLFRADDGSQFEVAPARGLPCTGDFLGCVTLARHGAGLVQASRYIVQDDVRQGRLVKVLRRFAGCSSPFSLLQPAGRAQSLAARLFADMLVESCASGADKPRKSAR